MIPPGKPARGSDRPNNNLLRRLSDADYALIAPYMTQQEASPDELLYNPTRAINTQNGTEEFYIRAAAPGVAI